MKCRECGGETTVTDTRLSNKYGSNTVHRRRVCNNCGTKFKTLEYVLPEKKKKQKSEVDRLLGKKYKKKEPEKPMDVHMDEDFMVRAARYGTLSRDGRKE